MAVEVESAVRAGVSVAPRQNVAQRGREKQAQEFPRAEETPGVKHWARGRTYAFLALLVLLEAVWIGALAFSAARLVEPLL